jgi:hypothetical protein
MQMQKNWNLRAMWLFFSSIFAAVVGGFFYEYGQWTQLPAFLLCIAAVVCAVIPQCAKSED